MYKINFNSIIRTTYSKLKIQVQNNVKNNIKKCNSLGHLNCKFKKNN